MGINFCKHCKGLIVRSQEGWICSVCRASFEEFSLSSSESMANSKEIALINEKDSEVLPVTDWNCQRCGNKKAYFWNLITTASDEADTIYHRCTKCGLTVQKGGQRGGR